MMDSVPSRDISDAKRKQLEQKYREFKLAPKYDLDSEELYCICRQADDGELMVCCDGCDEWFHFKCMKLNQLYKDLVNNYYCEFCDLLFDKGRTLWKKKCMVSNCYQPIRITDDGNGGKKVSKYCSDEHGLKYMSDLLNKKFLNSNGEMNSKDGLNREEISMVLKRIQSINEFKALGNKGMPDFQEFYRSRSGKTYELPVEVKYRLVENSKEVEKLEKELKIVLNKHRYLIRLKDKIRVFNDQIQRIEEMKQQRDEEQEEVEGDNDKKKKNKKKKKKKIKTDICGFENHLKLNDLQWLEFEKEEEYILLVENNVGIVNGNAEEEDQVINSLEELKLDTQKFEQAYESMINEEEEEEEVSPDSMDVDNLETEYLKEICIKDKKKCNKHATWFSIFNDRFKFRIDELKYEISELKSKKEKILVDLNIRSWEAYQLNELIV